MDTETEKSVLKSSTVSRQEKLKLLADEIARREKAAAELAAKGEVPTGEWFIDRRDASELSLQECRERYIDKFMPVVITGLKITESGELWTPEWLAEAAGSKMVAVHRGNSQKVCSGGDADVLTLGEVVYQLSEGSGQEDQLYLYDYSLPLKVPTLAHQLRIPAYFASDYLVRTRGVTAFSRSWPSLFLGAKGTHSSLHLDQWHGHFWMMVMHGRKRWSLWHPEDFHLLHPDYSRGTLDPAFPMPDVMASDPEKYPNFARARRADVILGPGELLLVPGRSPHQVENLDENVVALAANFIEASNFEGAMEDLRFMPLMEDTVDALDEVDFEEMDKAFSLDSIPGTTTVSYASYAAGAALEELARIAHPEEDALIAGVQGMDLCDDSDDSICYWAEESDEE